MKRRDCLLFALVLGLLALSGCARTEKRKQPEVLVIEVPWPVPIGGQTLQDADFDATAH